MRVRGNQLSSKLATDRGAACLDGNAATILGKVFSGNVSNAHTLVAANNTWWRPI